MIETVTESDHLLGGGTRWLDHRRFACWSADRDFVGWVLWGHIADEDAQAMKRLWIALAGRIGQPYDFVLDLRVLESISSGAFTLIREFAAARKPGLRRFALLAGDETLGSSIQIGLYVLRPPAFPWRSFRGWEHAAAWLERGDAGDVLSAVEQRIHARTAVATPLARLRAALLYAHDPAIGVVARELGMSTRSLQRSLAEWGTTFSDEHDRARVVRAQELLRDPDAKLDAIAAAIGCADRRSMNRLFRRVTGESPAEFRRRRGLA